MIQIEFKGQVIASNVSIANNFWTKLSGYMFRSEPHLPGILFESAPSVHMFFCKFPLDVVFLDRSNRIVKIYRNLKPWRHTWFHFSSTRTLELPLGKLPSEIKEGDILEVKDV